MLFYHKFKFLEIENADEFVLDPVLLFTVSVLCMHILTKVTSSSSSGAITCSVVIGLWPVWGGGVVRTLEPARCLQKKRAN